MQMRQADQKRTNERAHLPFWSQRSLLAGKETFAEFCALSFFFQTARLLPDVDLDFRQ
jgi:hypothetical protein